MMSYLVFNGDADGICAAHQFYLSNQTGYQAITGVKRDISLLKKIENITGSRINVFDIAVEKNLPSLKKLLKANCRILWFDHHISPETPSYPNIEYHIKTDADVNTSLIVSRYLNEPLSRWAIVGLFGDNMNKTAIQLSKSIGLSDSRIQKLERVGKLLNYNAYGSSLDDLLFHPADILRIMKPYDEPFELLRRETLIDELDEGSQKDFRNIEQAEWLTPNIVRLPNEKWARRVIGEFAYKLVRDEPDKDFAVLLSMGETYQVSIRIAANGNKNAGEFCLQFPTGGGREKAAGINVLPEAELAAFIDRFNEYFI